MKYFVTCGHYAHKLQREKFGVGKRNCLLRMGCYATLHGICRKGTGMWLWSFLHGFFVMAGLIRCYLFQWVLPVQPYAGYVP